SEVTSTGGYQSLSQVDFDRCLEFCATGGYALRAYPQWHRLIQRPNGQWGLRDPRSATRLRMNVGTIIDEEYVKVRLGKGRGGPMLGEVEEAFAATLTPGETFLIGGQVVQYDAIRETTLQVSSAAGREPRIAVFSGTKLAMSTLLSHRVLGILHDPAKWGSLPDPVRAWLEMQHRFAALPQPDRLLVESFPIGDRAHTVIYAFAGRNANQTLGLLISQRMEEAGLAPQGFLANDYALMIWGLRPIQDPSDLLGAEGLTEGFEDWLSGNAVMKKTFRNVAIIAGLIERNLPGKRKTGRQTAFSSDILYDTLRKFEPDHLLMQITRDEALRGLVDFGRIEEMLARSSGRVDHTVTDRLTPLAAPLMLERGHVSLKGGTAEDEVLAAEEAALLAELLPGIDLAAERRTGA
ncbi:MAG: DNA ligase-associated DEXH box helicase, partial [Pseudomonadota bacterium]